MSVLSMLGLRWSPAAGLQYRTEKAQILKYQTMYSKPYHIYTSRKTYAHVIVMGEEKRRGGSGHLLAMGLRCESLRVHEHLVAVAGAERRLLHGLRLLRLLRPPEQVAPLQHQHKGDKREDAAAAHHAADDDVLRVHAVLRRHCDRRAGETGNEGRRRGGTGRGRLHHRHRHRQRIHHQLAGHRGGGDRAAAVQLARVALQRLRERALRDGRHQGLRELLEQKRHVLRGGKALKAVRRRRDLRLRVDGGGGGGAGSLRGQQVRVQGRCSVPRV